MKSLFASLIALILVNPCMATSSTNASKLSISPQELVDAKIAAYNEGNIRDFVNVFADDVKTFHDGSHTPRLSGIKALEASYAKLFEVHPELHSEVKGKIIQDNYVIYQELVSGITDGDDFIVTGIYEVRDNKIQNIWFFW